jgi:hypothetical protein
MSKSRGNFLDPGDFVGAFGGDGARYVVLREVPFDKDAEVSWDGFVRRYNADLANDFGNLVNRTVSMANRYLGGERPDPGTGGPLPAGWPSVVDAVRASVDGCLLHEALAGTWSFVGDANRFVDAEKPWELNKAANGGDAEAAGASARRARRSRRGLPADRRPPRRSCPHRAARLAQLGSRIRTRRTATAPATARRAPLGAQRRRGRPARAAEPLFRASNGTASD